MERPSLGIKVTYNDDTKKIIEDVSVPVLRGSLQTQRNLPSVNSATAALFFEFGGESFDIELTEEQITKLNIQTFNKLEVKKDYSKKPVKK